MKFILETIAAVSLILAGLLNNTIIEISLSVIALILSIIALVNCKKNNSSKIFAIIVLLISILFVGIYIMGMIYFSVLSPERFMPTN